MPKPRTLTLALLILTALAIPATAGPIGFSGYYAPSNWSIENASNGTSLIFPGSVDFGGAPTSAIIHGASGGVNITIAAPVAGTVSFSYDLTDASQGYLYVWDGAWVPIATVSGAGSYSYAVAAGAPIRIDVGGAFIGATDAVTISDFNGPLAAPEPSSLALIALGGFALCLFRRRA